MNTKQNIREFYDQIGWQQVSNGRYQNTRYEDLRPVSQEYIHRCHMRVARHLKPEGRFLLDAGSGPIQYPEYLEYSSGYQARLCVDISLVALKEARKRIGERKSGGHGFFAVADIANLPFKGDAFDGVVSLHTIHHLPQIEHTKAYDEIHRVLAPESSAVVVNGWSHPPLMNIFTTIVRLRKHMWLFARRLLGKKPPVQNSNPFGRLKASSVTSPSAEFTLSEAEGRRINFTERPHENSADSTASQQIGTFVEKHDVTWIKREVVPKMDLEIRVWRSVNVRFLRNFVHENLGGRQLLWFIFWLEERFPGLFGEKGTYPLIVIKKPETSIAVQLQEKLT